MAIIFLHVPQIILCVLAAFLFWWNKTKGSSVYAFYLIPFLIILIVLNVKLSWHL